MVRRYGLILWLIVCGWAQAEFVVVRDGADPAPLVLAQDASVETKRAATSLADYVEKIAGVRPQLLTAPETPPEHAIWIGHSPGDAITFEHPEEIVIRTIGPHLVIAGRDRIVEGTQTEFGTANAIYTFIEHYLDVRWLWPGELGEELTPRQTIVLPEIDYRFHPVFRQRDIFARPGGEFLEWTRRQRLQLDSLELYGGHPFSDWWNRYSETHPEYFALQPDGTRSGFPSPGNAKLCEANPAVWQQWWDNVAASLAANPQLQVFSAAPNDGSSQGLCVCDDCRAWDNLDAPRFLYTWRGLSQEYVTMTDRYVRFWNTLAAGLEERYPERDLIVGGMAYGPAKAPPTDARLADNIAIGYVGSFPLSSPRIREHEKEQWLTWSAAASKLVFRPNVFWYSAGWHGIPTPAVANTIEDFRFLAEHNGIGLYIDHPPYHFSPLAPQHYVMSQLAWDPLQDGKALVADFYRRGFGDAAEPVRAYYELMESAHMKLLGHPRWRPSMGVLRWVADMLPELYSPALLAEAEARLNEAEARLAEAPERFRQRLAFVRTSLDYTQQHTELIQLMERVRQTGGRDTQAVQRALTLSEQREELFARFPHAYHAHHFHITFNRARTMQDYLGPPAKHFQVAAGLMEGETAAPIADQAEPLTDAELAALREAYTPQPADQQGWTLAFADDFSADTLSDDWEVLDGAFTIQEGQLHSPGGTLKLTREIPGFHRLEFQATTHVEPFPFFGEATRANVSYSDLSSFIQAGDDPIGSGYFMQFGGFNNTRNRLLRRSAEVASGRTPLITPGKVHHIVAEHDGKMVRLIVDGELVLAFRETVPLHGPDHQRVGLYLWTGARIDNLKVYHRIP